MSLLFCLLKFNKNILKKNTHNSMNIFYFVITFSYQKYYFPLSFILDKNLDTSKNV